MARKATYAELHESYARLEKSEHMMGRLLTIQYRGEKPIATESYTEKDGGKYRFELWDVDGALGGILVQVFIPSKGHEYPLLSSFDDVINTARTYCNDLAFNIALEHLATARQAHYAAKRVA